MEPEFPTFKPLNIYPGKHTMTLCSSFALSRNEIIVIIFSFLSKIKRRDNSSHWEVKDKKSRVGISDSCWEQTKETRKNQYNCPPPLSLSVFCYCSSRFFVSVIVIFIVVIFISAVIVSIATIVISITISVLCLVSFFRWHHSCRLQSTGSTTRFVNWQHLQIGFYIFQGYSI